MESNAGYAVSTRFDEDAYELERLCRFSGNGDDDGKPITPVDVLQCFSSSSKTMKQSFTMRVEEVDLKEWVRASHLAGMTISEWARRGLNQHASGERKNLRRNRPDGVARGRSLASRGIEVDPDFPADGQSSVAVAPAKPNEPEEDPVGNRTPLLSSSHRFEHHPRCSCFECKPAKKKAKP